VKQALAFCQHSMRTLCADEETINATTPRGEVEHHGRIIIGEHDMTGLSQAQCGAEVENAIRACCQL
jgi:hypothetical protein